VEVDRKPERQLTIFEQAGQASLEGRYAAIAASRIQLWLALGWGCRGRRLSRG
jgi:hypothetical protein